MPPPASFVTIGAFPYSRVVTQAEFNVDDEFWFQLITPVAIAFGQWTSLANGVELFANIYEDDGSTLIFRTDSNEGFWYPLQAGTYYIKLDIFPVGPISGDFTYEADSRPLDDIDFESESVLISDDTNDQRPAIILETDGNIPTFVSAIPTGEIGDALSNGYVLVHDRFGKYGTTNALILFNPNLTFNQSIVPPTPFTGFPRITHSNTDFYAVNPNTGEVWKITTGGSCTLVDTIPEILAGGVTPIGISGDGTLLYFAINDGSGNILLRNLTTNITTTFHTIAGYAGGDTIALTFDLNPGDLLVLPDGSIVTWWSDSSLSESKLIHISSAGVLLNTIVFTAAEPVNHISFASTTLSTHVKVWQFTGSFGAQSKIGNVNLSTGVFTTSFTIDTFDVGQNSNTGDSDKFGNSSSCPMYTLFTAVTPSTGNGGLYKLTLNSDHETLINGTTQAIPTPYFKTALIGD